MINVAVLGYGTVGSGVVEVIEKNKDMVNKKSAQELEVKYILDLRDFPGDPYENKVIHDFNTILQDDSVTIICETMGGVGAAYQFTKQRVRQTTDLLLFIFYRLREFFAVPVQTDMFRIIQRQIGRAHV